MSGLWYPIAKLLGPRDCTLLLRRRSLAASVPAGFVVAAADDVKVDWAPYRRWVRRRLRRWKDGLRKTALQHGLTPAAPDLLLALLVSQVYRLGQAKALARSLSPRAFLSIWDHGSLAGPLCSVLAARGVPTYTMVHGAIGAESMAEFAPLVADTVLVWGEYQRALFRNAGVADSRIKLVGSQRLARPSDVGPGATTVKESGHARHARLKVIMIGFTVLRTTDRMAWIEAVKRLVMSMPESRFILRLHPSNRALDYAPHFRTVPGVEVQEAGEASLEEALAASDAVVVDSSTLGFDALIQGKVVAVLDPYATPKVQDVMRDALDFGAAIYARSPEALAHDLNELSKDQSRTDELLRRARAFCDRYVCAYGDEAARRIVEVLTEPHAQEHASKKLNETSSHGT